MAGLIKRKNKWFATFRDASGKEIRKSTGIDVTPSYLVPGQSMRAEKERLKAQARMIASDMEAVVRGSKTAEQLIKVARSLNEDLMLSKVPDVETYMKRFLTTREDVKGAHDRDGKAIRQFEKFLGDRKNISLMLVTPAMARDFMERELERVSSGTVKRYLSTLSCAFNRAIAERLIESNPFRGVLPPKMARYDKQERGAFSADEVRRLIEVMPGEWPDMIKACLYTGGQRLGDIASLKWEQVDLENEVIYMTTEKTKRRMTKPMIGVLKDMLQRRYDSKVNSFVFPVAAMKFIGAGRKSTKLSLEFVGLLREHGFISERKEGLADRRVLAEKSFHSLRATAVTMLRLGGVPQDLCRIIVGHDSEDIERGYIRPEAGQISDALEGMAKELDQRR